MTVNPCNAYDLAAISGGRTLVALIDTPLAIPASTTSVGEEPVPGGGVQYTYHISGGTELGHLDIEAGRLYRVVADLMVTGSPAIGYCLDDPAPLPAAMPGYAPVFARVTVDYDTLIGGFDNKRTWAARTTPSNWSWTAGISSKVAGSTPVRMVIDIAVDTPRTLWIKASGGDGVTVDSGVLLAESLGALPA